MLAKYKKYVIANWKMTLSNQESIALAKEILAGFKRSDEVELVLCPTATALSAVGRVVQGSSVKLGAQNIFYHATGAYTGQISPANVAEAGAEYSIIGHSESRKFGESDDDVNRKVLAALNHNLIPIVCVGETFEEYNQRKTDVVIIKQVTRALEDIKLKAGQKIILAYEPVWVIGSGQAVNHSIVEHIVRIIVHTATELDPGLADKFDVIYGGSVDENNVNDFIIGSLSKGVIVGNKSLEAKSLIGLIGNIN